MQNQKERIEWISQQFHPLRLPAEETQDSGGGEPQAQRGGAFFVEAFFIAVLEFLFEG